MQAPVTAWHPPGGALGRILRATAPRIEALRGQRAALERAARQAPARPPVSAALGAGVVGLIAEVKRCSPSRGVINTGLSVETQVRAYVAGGAAAVSVLTESDHFGGAASDLEEAARCVDVPLLKKDFHVDPIQVVEARALGASALLLIVRALPPGQLKPMLRATDDWGLEALVEARTERELDAALAAGAQLIGVNNRDLETLLVDPATAERLIPAVPADRLAVAESGVADVWDVRRAARAGADAVLVGSALSAAPDPANAVRALCGVPKRRGARPR